MARLSLDTSPEAERTQIDLWRRMSARQRAGAVSQTSNSVRELAFAGIRRRYPAASESECRKRYAILTLGPTLAASAYPDLGALLDG